MNRRHRLCGIAVLGGLIGCAARDSANAPMRVATTPPLDTAATSAVTSHPPVRGLLRLPTIFGTHPCERYTPTPVSLHASPSASAPIGSIIVASPWTFPAVGGCEGLRVVSRRGTHEAPLPTREIGYEEPAVPVIGEAAGGWYRVTLDDTSAAWVQVGDTAQYRPLSALLIGALTYFSEAWDGTLRATPDASAAPALGPTIAAGASVRVLEIRSVGPTPWGRVEVLSHSGCEGDDTPRVTTTGWVPLHAPTGAPTVWFSSRGC